MKKDMSFYLVVKVFCPPFWHEVFLDLPNRKMLAVVNWYDSLSFHCGFQYILCKLHDLTVLPISGS